MNWTTAAAALAFVLAPVLQARAQSTGQSAAAAPEPAAVEAFASSPDLLDALFRKLVIEALPRAYVDDGDWGGTKLFTTDLHVHREGLKVETRRKRQALNHGTWEMVRVTLGDAEQFQLDLHSVQPGAAGRAEFVIDVALPLRIHARRAQWRRGVQLFSASADAAAILHVRLRCDAALRLLAKRSPPSVAIDPSVRAAEMRLAKFRLLGVSQIRGEAAQQLGRAIEGRLARRLAGEEERLVRKTNDWIAKSGDRLQISLAALAGSALSD